MKIGIVLSAVLLFAAPAMAAPLSTAEKTALSGEWHMTGSAKTCQPGEQPDLTMSIEFAATGGTLALDDNSEGAGQYVIKSATTDGKEIDLDLGEDGVLKFARSGKQLKAITSAGTVGDFSGQLFGHCVAAADRSAIKLERNDLRYLSTGMLPDDPIFIDARDRKGCKAIDYQYLSIDLVGPAGFKMGRANSFSVGEKLADGKKVSLPQDELTEWIVQKADTVSGGYNLTVTELIPPNGSRGDTTTVFLKKTATGFDIPAWKRSYVRCTSKSLAAE